MDALVSTDWLASMLHASDVRILDASFFLPADGRDARAEYEAVHIPGAVFFDLTEIADGDSALPGMLPPDYKFASRMQTLGVGDGDRIVVYDNSPHHSAARAWWMLKIFGAGDVAVLDGGLAKWRAEGRMVESAASVLPRSHFTARLRPDLVADKTFVASILDKGDHEIVDARGAQRFAGDGAEPRSGVLPGHIPGSRNLPQARLFNADDSMKQGEALRAMFDEAGVDLAKPMVTTCGSGVTAAVLLFAAHLLGKDDVRLYDGSWADWGSDPATPKAKGPA